MGEIRAKKKKQEKRAPLRTAHNGQYSLTAARLACLGAQREPIRPTFATDNPIIRWQRADPPCLVLSTNSVRLVLMLHLMRLEIIWKKRTILPHCSLSLAKALMPLIRVSRIFSKLIFSMLNLARSARTLPNSSLLSLRLLLAASYRSWLLFNSALAVSIRFWELCSAYCTALRQNVTTASDQVRPGTRTPIQVLPSEVIQYLNSNTSNGLERDSYPISCFKLLGKHEQCYRAWQCVRVMLWRWMTVIQSRVKACLSASQIILTGGIKVFVLYLDEAMLAGLTLDSWGPLVLMGLAPVARFARMSKSSALSSRSLKSLTIVWSLSSSWTISLLASKRSLQIFKWNKNRHVQFSGRSNMTVQIVSVPYRLCISPIICWCYDRVRSNEGRPESRLMIKVVKCTKKTNNILSMGRHNS